jgi:hypothetical protein
MSLISDVFSAIGLAPDQNPTHGPGRTPAARSRSQPCPRYEARSVSPLPGFITRAPEPQPNPHSARGTAAAPPTAAISCLGAFRNAGRRSAWLDRRCRRPKARTCQGLSARRLSIGNCQGDAPCHWTNIRERGRKFTLGRRDSKPSVGLVLKRSSTRGYTADYPTDIKRGRDFQLSSCWARSAGPASMSMGSFAVPREWTDWAPLDGSRRRSM